jgi:GT2 family glycosyltransferase
MRKVAWSALGGYDESMRDGYEDWDFNIRMANSGFRAIVIPKPLFVYRVSSEGMLLSHCTTRHATIWARMRRKNRNLYRLPALLRSWRANRSTSRLPLPVALAILSLAQLPDRWFNAIMNAFRYVRLFLQGWRAPSREPDAVAAK